MPPVLNLAVVPPGEYTHTHTLTCTLTHTHTHTHTHLHVHSHTHTHTHTHTLTCTFSLSLIKVGNTAMSAQHIAENIIGVVAKVFQVLPSKVCPTQYTHRTHMHTHAHAHTHNSHTCTNTPPHTHTSHPIPPAFRAPKFKPFNSRLCTLLHCRFTAACLMVPQCLSARPMSPRPAIRSEPRRRLPNCR